MQEPILELCYQPAKTNLGAVVSAIAALLGIYMLATRADDPTFLLAGALFAGVGVYGLIELQRRVGDTGVVLRIGPDGILDRRLGPSVIPWEYIIAIEERQTWGERPIPYLDLLLDQRAPLKAGLTSLLWRVSGARGFPVTHNGLEGTFSQIYRAAEFFAGKRGVPISTASSLWSV